MSAALAAAAERMWQFASQLASLSPWKQRLNAVTFSMFGTLAERTPPRPMTSASPWGGERRGEGGSNTSVTRAAQRSPDLTRG